MPRKQYTNPVPQTTMNISETAYEFIERRRKRGEPKYDVLDSLIEEYTQLKQQVTDLLEDIEALRIVNQSLRKAAKENSLFIHTCAHENIIPEICNTQQQSQQDDEFNNMIEGYPIAK